MVPLECIIVGVCILRLVVLYLLVLFRLSVLKDIGGVMVVVVTSVVLWLSWSHRWCCGCRGSIGGVVVVVVASVVLWLSW